MTTGSGSLDPAHRSPTTLKNAERREHMAGVPNTLPLQDLNRDAELGRVGYSLHPEQGNAATRSSRHRTKFYNMLETTGQTDRNKAEWLNFQNSATLKIVRRRATRSSAFSPDNL